MPFLFLFAAVSVTPSVLQLPSAPQKIRERMKIAKITHWSLFLLGDPQGLGLSDVLLGNWRSESGVMTLAYVLRNAC